jgi:hypothetical protein
MLALHRGSADQVHQESRRLGGQSAKAFASDLHPFCEFGLYQTGFEYCFVPFMPLVEIQSRLGLQTADLMADVQQANLLAMTAA